MENMTTTQDLAAQIAALTAAMQSQAQQPTQTANTGGVFGWGRPPVTQVQAQPNAVGIPIAVKSSVGSVKATLFFDKEFADPIKLGQLIEYLVSMNVPVDGWVPGGNKRGGWGR
jgi:FlaG/FlaF family flagellin (archaellin)